MTKIAIDLDDVCFDFLVGFERVYGAPKQRTGPKLADMYPQFSADQLKQMVCWEGVYAQSSEIPEASSTLRRLVRGPVGIFYVSARSSTLTAITRNMLAIYNFPNPNLTFLLGSNKLKIVYIESAKIDVVLDDQPEIVASFSSGVSGTMLTIGIFLRGLR